MNLEKYIDHTLLKPTATAGDINKLCLEAKNHNFYAVCVNSAYIPLARDLLSGTDINLAGVVGFPLGAMATEVKKAEAIYCLEKGANEIDVVINLGWFKSKEYKKTLSELSDLKKNMENHILKVIIETCYLTEDEKIEATKLVMDSGADFVKTSTGFGPGGATFEDVALMKNVVGNQIKIKASGGIKDRVTALKYIEMGVSRLGTSSGVEIIQGNQ